MASLSLRGRLLQQGHHLAIQRPMLTPREFSQPPVQIGGQSDSKLDFLLHAIIITLLRWCGMTGLPRFPSHRDDLVDARHGRSDSVRALAGLATADK